MNEEIIFCSDLQSSYAHNFGGGYQNGCAATNKFLHAAMECGLPVWASHYDFKNDFFGALFEETDSPEQRDHYTKKFTISGLAPDIQARSTVIFKNSPDTFWNPKLLPALKKADVQKIVMIGCYLSDCLSATALTGALKGFEITIIQDLAFDASGAPENRSDEAYAERVRDCLRRKLVGRIQTRYPSYDISARALYRAALDQVAPISLEEYEQVKDRCGPSRVEVASLYERQCVRLANMVAIYDRWKIANDMRLSRHPDYVAMENIKIMTADTYLVGLASRPVLAPSAANSVNSL